MSENQNKNQQENQKDVVLSIQGVTKEYKMGEVTVQALRGVDFSIYQGEFLVILGPSGSGKSTILNIIGGIDQPSEGHIIYKNKDISKIREKELTRYRRASVGFVFQFYNLIPNLTAKENILLASELSPSALSVSELLETIGLADRGDHFPSQMSGGQQQRVAIARAVAKNPEILLCDEPTGALDFSTGIQVLKILKDFNTERNKTVVIITHNAGIGGMADRVLYIKDGLIDRVVVNETPVSPEEVRW
ncbi:MAG: ABC transporter ATP-binding protein [Clostridiales bacterium]|jgi:putative ABC transport system ATP-binding protein|nr:ABC transporter ATP-binding protein [Clostridiales bacterium]